MNERRGLAFDLDGTLLDSMGFHAQAWVLAFREMGFEVEIEWFYLLEGVSASEVIVRTLRRFDRNLPAADHEHIRQAKNAFFDRHFQPLPMPGVYDLFRVVQRIGYPVAVVTGSENRVARRVLETLDLYRQVEAVVGGEDVLRGKPAPDPYLKAAEMLGLSVEFVLALENAPPGIESAKAAGLTCFAVETTLSRDYLMDADRQLPDLPAFTRFLESEYQLSGGARHWRMD